MIHGSLTDLARLLSATLVGADPGFRGVATDTRTLEPGQLFVALKGPRFDGHDFLAEAAARGAAGAVVDRPSRPGMATLRVADTLRALGAVASWWRGRFRVPVMALTGSFGKTTTKEMLACIAATRGETLATRGNLNNEIGLPLTLFRFGPEHTSAVLEMGANHAGEIARMTAIARPDVGLVTLAGAAHLEGFGSLEGVARGKGELFLGLGEDGVAVINADDPFAPLWREFAGDRKVVTFGLGARAELSATAIREEFEPPEASIGFQLEGPGWARPVRIPVAGRHNVMNALAAAAAAWAAGFTPDQIAAGLSASRSVPGRLVVRQGLAGSVIVDDTYNASPGAARAAIDFLAGLPGEAWVVLGDMGELGADARALHEEIGRYAREQGVTRFCGFGDLAAAAARAFGDGGEFSEVDGLVDALAPALAGGVNVLVKGSRSMRMERIVERLVAQEAG